LWVVRSAFGGDENDMTDLRWDPRARGFTWLEIFAVGLFIGAFSAMMWIAISPHLYQARPPAVAGPAPGAATDENRGVQPRDAVAREPIQHTIRDPNELLLQARILPKFEGGRMIGVAVNAIKPGSLLQKIGVHDGDVITQFNGITFDSPADAARIVREFANAEQFHMVIRGPNGEEQVHDFTR
jgi:membrane-associated protease RseP (regulator of RpoE activity)